MSDPAAPADARGPDRGGPPAPLTPDRIDAILGDFRGWLTELASAPPPATPAPPPVDLTAVVAQLTALRHEVNLQTKAARAATEQTAEALKLASAPKPEADPGEGVRPLVKTLVDIADALTIGLKQAEKVRDGLGAPDPEPAPEPPTAAPPRSGFLARVFGAEPPSDEPWRKWADAARERERTARGAAEKARPLLAGLADGYAMSLRRVERAFPQFGLEPVEVVGKPFDPDTMEAAEAVAAAGAPPGTVVEELRRGYTWHGKPFRFALVKVAR